MNTSCFTNQLVGKTVLVLQPDGFGRDLIVRHLSGSFECNVLPFSEIEAAQKAATKSRPDIIVIDAAILERWPDLRLPQLVKAFAPSPVVLFVLDFQSHFVTHSITSGVSGIVAQSLSLDRLDLALAAVAAGGTFLPIEFFRESQAVQTAKAPLSARELVVLSELAQGKSNRDIAQNLGLCMSTVKMHVSSVLRKTNTKNRAQAAVMAKMQGLPAAHHDVTSG